MLYYWCINCFLNETRMGRKKIHLNDFVNHWFNSFLSDLFSVSRICGRIFLAKYLICVIDFIDYLQSRFINSIHWLNLQFFSYCSSNVLLKKPRFCFSYLVVFALKQSKASKETTSTKKLILSTKEQIYVYSLFNITPLLLWVGQSMPYCMWVYCTRCWCARWLFASIESHALWVIW